MKIKFTPVLFSIFLFLSIFTQSMSYCDMSGFDKNSLAVKMGYFGEFIFHPGFIIGLEYPVYRENNFNLLLSTQMGGYIHPRNHNGIIADVQFGVKYIFPKGFFLRSDIGVGYLHTFPAGKIYEVVDDVLNEVPNTGNAHVMPSVHFGWGWEIRKTIPWDLQFTITGFGEYPFNGMFLPHIAIQIGITLYPWSYQHE